MRRRQIEAEGFSVDPWPTYRQYRRDQPVFWSEAMKSFALFRSADIRQVLTSAEFTVEYPFRTSRLVFGETLLDIDGPRHARVRRVLAELLLAPRAQELFQRICAETADAVVGKIAGRSELEFMAEVAEKIPILNTCRFLGFPTDDGPLLRQRLSVLTAGLMGSEVPAATLAGVRREIDDYILGVLAQRAALPEGSIGQLALRASAAGAFSPEEMLRGLFVLLAAGTETSESALGNLAACLIRFPEAGAAIRAGGEARDAVIREGLRWEPPQHDTVRFATRATQVAGVAIPAGSALRLYLASGNRDEAVYQEPEAFRPGRAEKLTLAFGYGKHVCLGAKLANLQLAATFGALLQTCDRIAMAPGAGEPVIEGDTFRRPRTLMIRLAPGT
jgi:cytochrome P450